VVSRIGDDQPTGRIDHDIIGKVERSRQRIDTVDTGSELTVSDNRRYPAISA
jgi:hypothetical protein